MAALTITEALQEIKTINKRLDAKRTSIGAYLARDNRAKDPLEKSGGSPEFVRAERQAIGDLEERIIRLRVAIQSANLANFLAVAGRSRSVAEWLTWRREVSAGQKMFLNAITKAIADVRLKAKAQGVGTVPASKESESGAGDVVINLDELELAHQREEIETVLGDLDGKLSLFNATQTISAY